MGLCSANTQTCIAGKWSDDTKNYKPTIEVCDNKENDCNGKIDELPFCTAATYCATINITSIVDILGMLNCIIADWQQNERNILPNDCITKITGSGKSLKITCVATSNAN